MRRESHVRFWEGPGVQFPRATRLVLGFEREADARRFHRELEVRLRQFNLELHPEKTRLFRFGRFAAARQHERGLGRPAAFDFLGFTHISGKSRAEGFVLLRHTSKKRMRAKLRSLRDELRRRMHLPVVEQGKWLASVVRGYFAYHAVPTNARAIHSFRYEAVKHWHRALRRRGQRGRITWERTQRLAERWIPPAHIQHPWPHERFDVRIQGRSRVR